MDEVANRPDEDLWIFDTLYSCFMGVKDLPRQQQDWTPHPSQGLVRLWRIWAQGEALMQVLKLIHRPGKHRLKSFGITRIAPASHATGVAPEMIAPVFGDIGVEIP